MALNNLGLGITFTARDAATPVMRRVQGGFRGMDAAAGRAGRGMMTGMAVAAAGVGSVLGGVLTLRGALNLADAAGSFGQALQRVANISGATGRELERLRDRAIQAGIETSFSPDEAVEGLASLAAKGFNTSESMEYLGQALNLAEGGLIGVEDAAGAVSSAIRVFSLSSEEAATTADRLLKITNMTALQAGDLTLALGTVARGAGSAKQNLNEMLIAMGLVKNTGVETSVAASSVSSALDFMSKNAEKFNEVGVSVTNADGTFRDFIDVVMDTDTALSSMTDEAERSAKVSELFGRFGKAAFVGVSNQINTGIRDATGNILRGAEAVEYLRNELGNAAGTAEEFRDKLLDTFAGQKKLLEGTLQTLAVVSGEAFAAFFKPIVKFITDSLNSVLQFINKLPKGVKAVIAGFIVFAGVGMIVFGVMTLLSVAFAFLLPMLPMIIMSFIALSAIMLPLAALFIAGAAAIGMFVWAVKNNVGGIGDKFREMWAKVKLAFNAIVQLFTQGGLSGAVLEELQKTENEGVLKFALNVFKIGMRIKRFFIGIWEGMKEAMRALAPTFTRLGEAFDELGEAFSDTVGHMGNTVASGDEIEHRGKVWGRRLAVLVELLTKGLIGALRLGAGAVRFFRRAWDTLGPMYEAQQYALAKLMRRIAVMRHSIDLFALGMTEFIAPVKREWALFSLAIAQYIDGIMLKMALLARALPENMRIGPLQELSERVPELMAAQSPQGRARARAAIENEFVSDIQGAARPAAESLQAVREAERAENEASPVGRARREAERIMNQRIQVILDGQEIAGRVQRIQDDNAVNGFQTGTAVGDV